MNRARRKRIDEVIGKLQDLQGEIEDITSEEEEYRDNMPENLVNSEKYETAETACGSLDSAYSAVGEAVDMLEESKG
ncbi:hypothetical protein V8Q34_14910 [Blautia sp. JLR.GB0024]|uniref:hypothetical protein n=1 Tax=Blautia sp. JLR.GB0024 TaxID=3123295 RepID=UPI003003FDBE